MGEGGVGWLGAQSLRWSSEPWGCWGCRGHEREAEGTVLSFAWAQGLDTPKFLQQGEGRDRRPIEIGQGGGQGHKNEGEEG